MPYRNGQHLPGPLFFLSYAHPHRPARSTGAGRSRRLEARFFDDLSDHLDELTGPSPGDDLGFMDEATMQGGERWTPDLVAAVTTCHVFVALLSERYLTSAWCRAEWLGFAQRRVTPLPRTGLAGGTSGHHTAILPVLWSPLSDPGGLPDWIASVQRFTPRHEPDEKVVARYQQDGLYGLLTTADTGYDVIVWRLALRIREVFRTYHVAPGGPQALRGDAS